MLNFLNPTQILARALPCVTMAVCVTSLSLQPQEIWVHLAFVSSLGLENCLPADPGLGMQCLRGLRDTAVDSPPEKNGTIDSGHHMASPWMSTHR